jgi:hypothetical protein
VPDRRFEHVLGAPDHNLDGSDGLFRALSDAQRGLVADNVHAHDKAVHERGITDVANGQFDLAAGQRSGEVVKSAAVELIQDHNPGSSGGQNLVDNV